MGAKCLPLVSQCQALLYTHVWIYVDATKPIEKAVFMSDTLADEMGQEKQSERITVRVGTRLYQLAQTLVTDHKAEDFSDYVRGLIVRDAVQEHKPTEDVDFPAWTMRFFEVKMASPRSSEPSPTEGNEPRGKPRESSDDKPKPRKKS